VGKLLADVLFSVEPKRAAFMAPPFPVELLTMNESGWALIIAGKEESAT